MIADSFVPQVLRMTADSVFLITAYMLSILRFRNAVQAESIQDGGEENKS
jgi:hypothetical protein